MSDLSIETLSIEELVNKFKELLSTEKYIDEINNAIIQRRKSIAIDFHDIVIHDKVLADLVIEKPRLCISSASEAIKQLILEKDPEFGKSIQQFYARFRRLPEIYSVRKLTSDLIGKFIMIEGIVTRQTPRKHFIKKLIYRCSDCGLIVEIPCEKGIQPQVPRKCVRCNSSGSFILETEKSEYIDWQKIIVQEKPEELPPGQLPRSVEVILYDDLVDTVKPGDRIYVTGILELNVYEIKRGKPPVISSYIEANYVESQHREFLEIEITPEDERKIFELSRQKNVREKIIRSIAPSIYGLEDIKEAIACLLFGGVPKIFPDGIRVRGDIHVLLIGDPGTGKSLTYSIPILYFDPNKGLQFEYIGKFVDSLIEKYKDRVEIDEETEILNLIDLGIEFYVPAINPKTFSVEWKRVKAVIRHKAPDTVVKVKTRSGRELILTKDHSLLIFQDGQIIPVKPLSISGRRTVIPYLKKIPLPKQLGLKSELNWNIDYFIGRYLGDGSITLVTSGERLEITSTNKEILEYLRKVIEKYFKAHSDIYRQKDNTYRLISTNKSLTQFLKKLTISKPELLHLVKIKGFETRLKCLSFELVLNASEDFLKGLISGILDSNGHVLSFLLEKQDELMSIKKQKINCIDVIPLSEENVQDVSKLNINTDLLRNKAAEFRAKVYRGYVGEEYAYKILNTLVQLVNRSSKEITDYPGLYKLKLTLDNEHVGWDVIEKVHEVSITEVEPEHSEYVYDLSVEDYENFVAGWGLIFVHNSQLLRFVAKIAPRAVYTTGKGSSAAGLTAAVVKDKLSGDFYLEAGALVLADMGVCIIDEIDKMDAKDRVAMHEALEQQSVSIAKAGIVATLNARCSVLAAANPAFGRYLPNRTVAENVDLPVTLLSRFDLIFIIRDEPQLDKDKLVATHISTLHAGELPEEYRDIIPPDLLRKYIAYARKFIKPILSKEAKDRIVQFYLQMRGKSTEPHSPVAITARQLEALIRLAEAEARMRLSQIVTAEDAERAIKLFMKFLQSVGIDVETGKIDIDIIMTGKPRSTQEKVAALINIITKLEEFNNGKPVKIDDIYREGENYGMDRTTIDKLISMLIKSGELYQPKPGYVKRVTL